MKDLTLDDFIVFVRKFGFLMPSIIHYQNTLKSKFGSNLFWTRLAKKSEQKPHWQRGFGQQIKLGKDP